jgi:voltage-gated potassium channel
LRGIVHAVDRSHLRRLDQRRFRRFRQAPPPRSPISVEMPPDKADKSPMAEISFRARLRSLYYGGGRKSRVLHLVLIGVDVVAIIYFLATVRVPHVEIYRAIDLAFFGFFALELALRFLADRQPRRFFVQPSTVADFVVLASLILPIIADNLGFLRIVRTLRFLRILRIVEKLRRIVPLPRRQEDVFTATLNLLVFVFVVTSTVWVLEAPINPGLDTWVDALYFTVATLTTTGFGDITLKDPLGRLLTVFIMIFGVALFLRLAQSIFRPYKVPYACPSCGLKRHDPDASHCKHCGNVIRIETEGNW